MKNYVVSINIVTALAGLSELSERLGINASQYSQERGSRIAASPRFYDTKLLVGRKFLKHTCWRLEARSSKASDLRSHLDWVFRRFPFAKLKDRNLLPPDARVSLDIGVMLDGPIDSFEVPPEYVKLVGATGFKIEVSYYRCSIPAPRKKKQVRARTARSEG
jgi:hypothetical protein